MGKLYGGSVIKRKKKRKKSKSLFKASDFNSSGINSPFLSKNDSGFIKRVPTPKIPVSYFCKESRKPKHSIKRSQNRSLTMQNMTPFISQNKYSFTPVNQPKKSRNFSNALEKYTNSKNDVFQNKEKI